MAQSRTPHTSQGISSPPLHSPPTHNSERKHHSRRKSGRTEYVVSEKKSSRPTTLSRRTAPQIVTKVGSTTRGQEQAHRERKGEERIRDRDSGESFPQFCMSCEKQFLPANNTFLYCSEACRVHDHQSSQSTRTDFYSSFFTSHSPPLTPFSRIFPTHEDGPDIIPRFSPTQPRPRSYFASEPYPSSYHHVDTQLSQSTPHNIYADHAPKSQRTNSSALESLRELATALPPSKPSRKQSHHQDDSHSPPKSSASSMAGVWNYMPFTKTSTPAATPGNSYTSTQYTTPYTNSQSTSYSAKNGYGNNGYGNGSREDLYNYGGITNGYNYSSGGSTVNVTPVPYSGAMGMDRPLPPRTGPGGYGHRPKSIDLVTPFSGH